MYTYNRSTEKRRIMKEAPYTKFVNIIKEAGLELKDMGLLKVKTPGTYFPPIQMWPNSEKLRSPFKKDSTQRTEN
jgi:hypothetical protein